jgi:hypothetical protein
MLAYTRSNRKRKDVPLGLHGLDLKSYFHRFYASHFETYTCYLENGYFSVSIPGLGPTQPHLGALDSFPRNESAEI